MTEHEAQRRFESYLPWFRECWWAGWNDYKERFMHPWDDGRFRAATIQNRAIIHGRDTLSKYPEVSFLEFNTRRLFKFDDWAIVQFKKLSEWQGNLHISNNVNAAVEAFDSQEPVMDLGDAPRFTVGYLPNEFHTDMSVYLLFTKSHYANNWVLNISGNPVAKTLELFPEPDEQVSLPTRRVRVKGKPLTAPSDDDTAQG